MHPLAADVARTKLVGLSEVTGLVLQFATQNTVICGTHAPHDLTRY